MLWHERIGCARGAPSPERVKSLTGKGGKQFIDNGRGYPGSFVTTSPDSPNFLSNLNTDCRTIFATEKMVREGNIS